MKVKKILKVIDGIEPFVIVEDDIVVFTGYKHQKSLEELKDRDIEKIYVNNELRIQINIQ